MSLSTWLLEYMPHAADSAEAQAAPAAHSLRKWRGLTRENLERHGLARERKEIFDLHSRASFIVGVSTCSLCVASGESDASDPDCSRCVLAEVRDGTPCDDDGDDGAMAPYDRFVNTGDPAPMLRDLERAAALERERQGR